MGTVAKKTERTMPITPAILTLNHALRAVLVVVLCLSLPLAAMAGPKFTLVVSGKITTVDAMQAPGGNLVSVRAVGELVKSVPGTTMSADKETGVVSITRNAPVLGATDAGNLLAGLKAGPLTFVVDGKIQKSTVKLSNGGVFLPVKDLKKLAESLGFAAELDAGASVLALTQKAAPASATPAAATPPAGGEERPSFGLNGTFMEGVASASGAAAGPVNTGDGSVCGYMDGMKTLWLATEPTSEERDTLKRLTTVFQAQSKKKQKGNPADLKLLETTLKGFDAKLQRRYAGTRDTPAPAGAEAWRNVSVEFLEKVDQVMRISFDLVRVMKLPKDKAEAEGQKPIKNAQRLQALNAEVQAIGARQVTETVEVRESNGCAPP